MLFGLRRIGKSTEANPCVERLRRAHPQTVIYQDAQGCASETKLLLDMLKQLAAIRRIWNVPEPSTPAPKRRRRKQ